MADRSTARISQLSAECIGDPRVRSSCRRSCASTTRSLGGAVCRGTIESACAIASSSSLCSRARSSIMRALRAFLPSRSDLPADERVKNIEKFRIVPLVHMPEIPKP
jgi:hypothetical protein